jgi:hypothetical protein
LKREAVWLLTLFPGRLAQGVVDPVLPAEAAFPEMIEDVLIDP